MKKVLCFLSIFSFMFLIDNVNALEISKDEIANGTYIIGNYSFDRNKTDNYNGTLTVEHIMLSSQSINSSNLSDMKIYFKNSRGKWVNPINNNELTNEEIPTNFDIDYENLQLQDFKIESPVLKINWSRYHGITQHIYDVGLDFDDQISILNNMPDGYELWEVTGNTKYLIGEYKIENGEHAGVIQTAEIEVRSGEKRNFDARYFKTINGVKFYSDYSEEYLVIEAPKPETPVISLEMPDYPGGNLFSNRPHAIVSNCNKLNADVIEIYHSTKSSHDLNDYKLIATLNYADNPEGFCSEDGFSKVEIFALTGDNYYIARTESSGEYSEFSRPISFFAKVPSVITSVEFEVLEENLDEDIQAQTVAMLNGTIDFSYLASEKAYTDGNEYDLSNYFTGIEIWVEPVNYSGAVITPFLYKNIKLDRTNVTGDYFFYEGFKFELVNSLQEIVSADSEFWPSFKVRLYKEDFSNNSVIYGEFSEEYVITTVDGVLKIVDYEEIIK